MNSEEVNRAANAVAAAEAELQELPLRDRTRRIQSAIAAQTTMVGATVPMMTEVQLNSTLFISNLPNETTREALQVLFRQFSGYRDVRLVPGREGIAFIDFDSEVGAASAKGKLFFIMINYLFYCFYEFLRGSQWFSDLGNKCNFG